MVFEEGITKGVRSEQAQILSELVNEKDYQTKSRVKNAHAQAVFMMLGFDMLDEESQRKVLKHVGFDLVSEKPGEARPAITIGHYFFAMDYFDKINGISEGGKSRDEFVAAMGSAARAEEAKTTRMLKGLFGS